MPADLHSTILQSCPLNRLRVALLALRYWSSKVVDKPEPVYQCRSVLDLLCLAVGMLTWSHAKKSWVSMIYAKGSNNSGDAQSLYVWHTQKLETWGLCFTTQFEHLCKTVNRTTYLISIILQKDLFYFILLPSKQSDMSNLPAKMMPQNWIL